MNLILDCGFLQSRFLNFLHQDPVKLFSGVAFYPGPVAAFLQENKPEVFEFLSERKSHAPGRGGGHNPRGWQSPDT